VDTRFDEDGELEDVLVLYSEADKKGAQQMVANTSIKIFMKMEDHATLELAKGLAGQGHIVQTSGFKIDERSQSTSYQDGLNTQIVKEDRVHLRDFQEQIEGEAHFIFRGQVVRGNIFYANPPLKNAQLRVPQMLESPEPEPFKRGRGDR
jgi:intracellular multiplication protein IcmO